MHNWERSAGLWTPVSPLGQPDSRYIRVETCMFMVKLPQYTSLDVMLEKLRYAIHYREDPLSGWEDLTTEYSPPCAPNLALTRDPFSPFIPKFLDFPLRQTLCSAALTSHKVNFITFSVAMLCLSLLYIAVYTNCTFHYFDLFCFFFSSCYCILFYYFFFFSREFREDILNWHWHGVWGRRWSEPTVRLFVHLFLPFPLTEGLTRFSQILWI